MRLSCKQFVTGAAPVAGLLFVLASGVAHAQTAGGLAAGESAGGVTDRAYISAPPNYLFIVERSPGSFLDCGEGMDQRSTDAAGRDLARLTCGVTLTETMIIPAAAESARLVVHY